MDLEPVHTIDEKNGRQYWTVDNLLHREDGPAWINQYGDQEWHQHGRYHRIDGPAYMGSDGTQEWFINDRDITQEVEQWMKLKEITWPWDEQTQVEFLLTWT